MASKGKTILVVDDHHDYRVLISSCLERRGFDIMTANDGNEGLKVITSGIQLVAVVTDVQMPNMDGIELLSSIRAYNAALPVIVVSGRIDLTEREVCNQGAACFFSKPVNLDLLADRISQLSLRALE